MDTVSSVIVIVLCASGISGLLGLYCALARRLKSLEDLPSNQASHPQQWSAPPLKPGAYVLSDRELAAKEQAMLVSSRQRAAVLDAGARQRLIRTFRRG